MTDVEVAHDDLRPLMFSIAYRMTGSVAEAEDVVQDAFLRMHVAEQSGDRVGNVEAFATTVTTRLAIDALRSARIRRERYVGTWLPEPLLEGPGPRGSGASDPAGALEEAESVSLALLVVLEELSPLERAVFVLREALGYDYGAISEVVERSEAACRQVLSRARRRISAARPRLDTDRAVHRRVVEDLVTALRDADLPRIETLLTEDVVLAADGGGRTPAVSRPVVGATAVARLLAGLMRRGTRVGVGLEPASANGQPAVLVRDADGRLLGVLGLDVVDGSIAGLHNQINPDKLAHLGPVGDLAALLSG